MQGKCVSFLVGCAALISATAAGAQDDFARNGVYLGVNVVGGFYTQLDNTGGIDVDPAPGVNGHLGYRFHPNFAGEVEVEYIAPADVDGSFTAPGSEVEWSITAMGNIKGYMLTGRFQPFGVLGMGYMRSRVDSDFTSGSEKGRFAARLGGGLDVYFTERFLGTLGASYVIPDDELSDFAYVSAILGLGFRF
jgi:opacity protein-like surface antigen